MPVEPVGKYCRAVLLVKGPKTNVWDICNETDVLGVVSWFGRWRTYAFFPRKETGFEKNCLRAIADFCERKTGEQREARPDARKHI